MGSFIDLTNKTFGRLTVISISHKGSHGVWFWNCRCACGNICVKRGYHLRNGSTKSCGCLEKENLERLHGTQIKHHQSKAPLYKVWKAMKSRCLNLNDKRYARYGGRGITICHDWIADYAQFERWALENGYDAGLTIDRIDNDENYCLENCRFVTIKKNNRNNSMTKLNEGTALYVRRRYAQGGITQKELAKQVGSTQQTVSKIINNKLWN